MPAPNIFDAITGLKAWLETNWGDHEPAIQDYYNGCSHTWHNTLFVIRLDEVDTNAVAPQLLLETGKAQSFPVIGGLLRKEQPVKVTAFIRPKNYNPDSIEAARRLFRGLKTRFVSLLAANKHSVTITTPTTQKISDVVLGDWDDSDTVIRGHDVKARHRPIEFKSVQNIRLVYYEVTGSPVILTRVVNVLLGATTLTTIKSAAWKSADPWVVLEIPGGTENVFQNLRPPMLEGSFESYDLSALLSALSGYLGVVFSEDGTEFKIRAADQGETTKSFKFYNVRIHAVEPTERWTDEQQERTWTLKFSAKVYDLE